MQDKTAFQRFVFHLVEVRRIELLSKKCPTFRGLQFILFAFDQPLRNRQTSVDLLTGLSMQSR